MSSATLAVSPIQRPRPDYSAVQMATSASVLSALVAVQHPFASFRTSPRTAKRVMTRRTMRSGTSPAAKARAWILHDVVWRNRFTMCFTTSARWWPSRRHDDWSLIAQFLTAVSSNTHARRTDIDSLFYRANDEVATTRACGLFEELGGSADRGMAAATQP